MRIDIGDWQIRSFTSSDADALARHANNRNISRNLRDTFPFPYTIADAEEWIRYATGQSPETNFAIASSSEAIGGIGLRLQGDVHRLSAEVGYWGRGAATAALAALTQFAFSRFGLVRLYGFVYEWNSASARVMEKAGYVCEGGLRKSVVKDGEVIDQFIFAMTR